VCGKDRRNKMDKKENYKIQVLIYNKKNFSRIILIPKIEKYSTSDFNEALEKCLEFKKEIIDDILTVFKQTIAIYLRITNLRTEQIIYYTKIWDYEQEEKYRIESIRKNADRILKITLNCLCDKHIMLIDVIDLGILIENLNVDYKRIKELKK